MSVIVLVPASVVVTSGSPVSGKKSQIFLLETKCAIFRALHLPGCFSVVVGIIEVLYTSASVVASGFPVVEVKVPFSSGTGTAFTTITARTAKKVIFIIIL